MWYNVKNYLYKVLEKRSFTLSPPSPPVTPHIYKGLCLPKTGDHKEIFIYGLIQIFFFLLSMLFQGRRF